MILTSKFIVCCTLLDPEADNNIVGCGMSKVKKHRRGEMVAKELPRPVGAGQTPPIRVTFVPPKTKFRQITEDEKMRAEMRRKFRGSSEEG